MYTAKPIPASSSTHATHCNCPACRGVNCFERPRFFAGQPLTDKDLEAAQRYVIEKNKLHNRYLVGTGVVCGLMVKCDPCCDGSVVVETGYAIDCDGNDIVLCQEASFDVLGYLKKRKNQEDLPYCGHTVYNKKAQPVDEKKEYLLVLSYAEEMAKPITALVRDNGCNNSRCEPSRIRETFQFDLIETRTDKPDLRKLKVSDLIPDQSFLGQVIACFKTFQEVVRASQAAAEGEKQLGNDNVTALNAAFKQIRNLVMDFYQKEPTIRCDLPAKIADLEKGFQAANTPKEKQNFAVYMVALLLQLLLDCVCDALLVRCPECKDGEGVVLACITIQGGKIEKICNIVRKQLITGPSLQYWMQPLFSSLETLLDFICCDFDIVELIEQQLSHQSGQMFE
ncbi:MAG: hypothetical protein KME16_00325 [Scytolyngbya sp. HA4215-MV1]|jgi:hypothetical protein|nr:hypothetical protein [Scytolyngbya sp. HA4215-MV1]